MDMIRVLASILAIMSGVFLFIYGEADDSPGAQLLGLVIGIAGGAAVIRALIKRGRKS